MKFIKFACVCGSGTLLSLFILWFFTDIVGLHYLISYTISFLVVVTSNYLLNTFWTFKDKVKFRDGLLKYSATSLGTFCLRQGILYVSTDLFGIYYLLSALIATGSSFIFNYILSKRFVWAR
jgi:dolichol-phosphate mannosyltransferase